MTDPHFDEADQGEWHDQCWPQMYPDSTETGVCDGDCSDWFPECRSERP